MSTDPDRAQLVDRRGKGRTYVGHVVGGIVSPEEVVGKGASTGEQLVGDLAAQHPPVGHTFAGPVLGKAVKLRDPYRRKGEQVPVGTAVHHEGVSESSPGLTDHCDGIADRPVPGHGHGFVPRAASGRSPGGPSRKTARSSGLSNGLSSWSASIRRPSGGKVSSHDRQDSARSW